jgi:hypothetical protein
MDPEPVMTFLLAHGLPGRAIITHVRDTRTTAPSDDPRIELTLEVTVGDDAPYTATHTLVIAWIAIRGFHPGATVPVRVDPADERSLIIA